MSKNNFFLISLPVVSTFSKLSTSFTLRLLPTSPSRMTESQSRRLSPLTRSKNVAIVTNEDAERASSSPSARTRTTIVTIEAAREQHPRRSATTVTAMVTSLTSALHHQSARTTSPTPIKSRTRRSPRTIRRTALPLPRSKK